MLTSPTTQPDEAVAHAVGVLDTFIAMGSRDTLDLCQAQADMVGDMCGLYGDLGLEVGRHVFLYEDGHLEVEPMDGLRPPGRLVTPGGLLLNVSETGRYSWELQPHSRLRPLLEAQRKDILTRGVEAITLSGSDPVGGYNPTQAVMSAYFSGTRYPHLDVELLELEKTHICKLIEGGEIAKAGSLLKEHLVGVDTYPGVLKYLSQVAELRPLLDFWEELRVIQGGLI